MINNACVLEHIKTLPDFSVNTTFADPPYFLGSEWHYVDGRLQMKGAGKDFMHGSKNAWSVNNADWWREYFIELHRVMKYGGYVCFYSISQQDWAFRALMVEAGFEPCQTMYWANISNFPKSSDASNNIDKAFGLEREIVGSKEMHVDNGNGSSLNPTKNYQINEEGKTVFNITAPNSDLAKTFDGYKYGRAPLKKITEPLLVFRKTPKSKSVLHDLLAYQTDSEISPAVLDIENNRVATKDDTQRTNTNKSSTFVAKTTLYFVSGSPQGRFPATLFLTNESAEMLDSQLDCYTFELNGKLYKNVRKITYMQIVWEATQNGTLKDLKVWAVDRELMKGNDNIRKNGNENTDKHAYGTYSQIETTNDAWRDSGYLSRIMHKANFTQDDFDSYVNALNAYTQGVQDDTVYEPVVSPNERNEGLQTSKKVNKRPQGVAYSKEANIFQDSEDESNNHPTLKPIELNQHFLSLLRLPKGIEQTLYIPFCGSGSEVIGAIKAGYNPDNIIAIEINPNFVKIAKARIAYFTKDKNAIGMFE